MTETYPSTIKRTLSATHPKLMLPVLPLRGMIIFPSMIIHIDVVHDKSVAALEHAFGSDRQVFFSMQKDKKDKNPKAADCEKVGTIATLRELRRQPDGSARIVAEGVERAGITSLCDADSYMAVTLERLPDTDTAHSTEKAALHRSAMRYLRELSTQGGHVSQDAVAAFADIADSGLFSNVVAGNVLLSLEKKQRILDEPSQTKRLMLLCESLLEEREIAVLERQIQTRVQKQIEKHQRESYLMEQLQAIREELGEGHSQTDKLRERFDSVREFMNEEARAQTERLIARASRMNPDFPEAQVLLNKLDWLVSMPWAGETNEELKIKNEKLADVGASPRRARTSAYPRASRGLAPTTDTSSLTLSRAREILARDHYGLEDVKTRLLEYIAVNSASDCARTPVLCLVGEPGVGKTSVAKSVAEAMGRKFVRLSLGGMRDEAEIRGHRSTYIGAMPGGIIGGIKRAGVSNPVFLLDEIDKLGQGVHGDPASALLEALDPEQNGTFRDYFLDCPFPLTDVLFITTANTLDTIPRPLLDRMEVIEIRGYTADDKTEIAKRYLLPRQMKAHGLLPAQMRVSEAALSEILRDSSREAGVRELERSIAAVCRKAKVRLMETGRKSITINERVLEEMFGQPSGMRRSRYGATIGFA
ncbi:MAG: LON peptidase substrate-binding domain-containing protein [Oscillospiraceae bacterium]|jgi:ATP-dependent Lon protease|nr:LON peptidase substrate-binding domain-containing protein [Oscillospiraceae bacterium]